MAKKKLTIEDVLVPKEMIPYDVPENWCWVKLGSIAEIVTGNTPSKKNEDYYGDYIPFVKPADLDQGRSLLFSNEYLSQHGLQKARIIPKNSTAVCCIGSIGKSAFLEVDVATNQQINSVIPKNINSLYLYYYILSEEFQKQLWANSSATTISIINKSKMSNLNICIPPLAEQERIVNRIESLFEKVDKASELVEEARKGFEKRRAAILEKAFNGELTKSWRKENGISDDRKVISIKDVLNPMTTKKPNLENKTFRYIDIDAIDNKNQEVREPKVVDVNKAPSRASREVKSGDTLFSLVRPYLKNIAYINEDFSDCIASTGFYVCRPNENILPKYLYNILCSNQTVNFYTSMMKGDNSPSIRKGEFESLNINLPSIEEQEQIIKIIDKVLENEKNIEELCDIEKSIDIIKKSILAKAFRGELGSNDLEEESSIELLKAILK